MSTPQDRLSKKYYSTFCGGCRKVLLDKHGHMDEYPHNLKWARLCKLPGKHPHEVTLVKISPRTVKKMRGK